MRYEVINSVQPIECSVPQQDGVKGIKVRGTAIASINDYPNLNGFKYPHKTLQQYASSLKGFPMVMDHEDKVTNVVGRVINAWFENGRLLYEADINPDHPSGIAKALERGDINSVSIKAYSNDVRCSICGSQLGECYHRLLENYEGQICSGIVHHLDWVHLSFVTRPADPYASDTAVAQSIKAENQKRMTLLIQNINSLEVKKIGEKKMANENKISQEEFEKLQQSLINTLKKENEAEIKQREAEISALQKQLEEAQKFIQQYEDEKKSKLISQICDISGEDPKIYENMSISSLEKIKQSVMKLKKKYDTVETAEQVSTEGNFSTKQPVVQQYDDFEEGVKFFNELFNLKNRFKEIRQEDKRKIREISQREMIRFGNVKEEVR